MELREWDALDHELEGLGLFTPQAKAGTAEPPAQVGGFPFAEPPPQGSYWPVGSTAKEGRLVSYLAADGTMQGRRSREFMALRFNSLTKKKDRYHLGVDLFAHRMDPVYACEDGRIVHFMPRFLWRPGLPNYTSALFIEHAHVTNNYGEVHPESLKRTGLKVGDRVRAGQLVGFVGINPGGSSMLHFEVYRRGVRSNQRWAKDEPRPSHVLNPAKYLVFLRDHGLAGSSAAGAAGAGAAGASGSSAPAPRGGGARLDVDRAVRENARFGERLGWMPWYDAIAYVLGSRDATPTQARFAEDVAAWQARQGLGADGIIGPQTWARLQPLLTSVPAFLRPRAPASPAPGPPAPTSPAPPSPAPTSGASGASGSVGAAALEAELFARVRESWQRHGLPPPEPGTLRKYTPHKAGGWSRYGGPFVDTTLELLRAKGLVDVRDEDVDMLQRISNVETGGHLNALNSWDSAVMSVGYVQWTLKYGELQAWISRAPQAFARYGIRVDPSRRYGFSEKVRPLAIAGAGFARELRSREWGARFFLAGLDADAVIASVGLALEDAARVKKAHVVPQGPRVVAFYDGSPLVRAIVQEAHNNRPAYLKAAMARVGAKARAAGPLLGAGGFLELLRSEVRAAFPSAERHKAENILTKTAVRRLGKR